MSTTKSYSVKFNNLSKDDVIELWHRMNTPVLKVKEYIDECNEMELEFHYEPTTAQHMNASHKLWEDRKSVV